MVKQEYVSLISGIHEFKGHVIIMESASTDPVNFGSPCFGQIPKIWLNFSFLSKDYWRFFYHLK
jgi:hypothetical protein